MNKVNWIIHYVIGNYGPGGCINAHTHGMEKYGHLDFQCVLNTNKGDIMYLLNTLGRRVQYGERFSPGDMVEGLFLDCPVRLDLFKETGRTLLRLIIPDGFNTFPENPACKAPYKYQIERMFEQ